MRWQQLRWWLIGALAYLLFLAATLPASYLNGWLASRFPEVQLVGLNGTLLSGKAEQLRIQSLPLGSLSWHFDWLALATASYGYRFELVDSDRSLEGRADARFGRLYLRDLKGHAPLAALDRWLPLPPHSLSGSLDIDLKTLELKDSRLAAAEGDISLENANLSWPAAYALGSFRADVSDAGNGGIRARIADSTSPLELRADLTLDRDGHYHLAGTLAAHNPGDAGSQKLLAYMGSPDATGHYPFDFSGQW
jgi:hypothetical protein